MNGVDWNGVDWNRVDWTGMEWNDWDGVDFEAEAALMMISSPWMRLVLAHTPWDPP